jgi:MFS family permease
MAEHVADAREPTGTQPQADHRWLVLVIVAIAQLMVVLDSTIVNIALPSAQHDLGFANSDRQWVVTAYALAFGSLLLLGGRIGDMFSRKAVFITGLIGFAGASALGGASVSFGMLVTARTLQGAFGAILAPAALGTLVSTFREPRERGRAFGVFGSVAGGGGAVGLILGGVLTEYLNWRWTLYVNLVFAAIAVAGAMVYMQAPRPAVRPRMDWAGTVLACTGLFGIVFGFSHAETAGWSAALTLGSLAAGVVLLAGFVLAERRAQSSAAAAAGDPGPHPRRRVRGRRRGRHRDLRRVPVPHLLPADGQGLHAGGHRAGVPADDRVHPRRLQHLQHLPAAPARAAHADRHRHAARRPRDGLPHPAHRDLQLRRHVLPPLLAMGLGFGMIIAPAINTATAGVRPQDSGVASALVNTMQQVGGSIGTAALSTFALTATAHYLTAHPTAGGAAATAAAAATHGYVLAFAISAGLFGVGVLLTLVLLPSKDRLAELRAAAGRAAPRQSASARSAE